MKPLSSLTFSMLGPTGHYWIYVILRKQDGRIFPVQGPHPFSPWDGMRFLFAPVEAA